MCPVLVQRLLPTSHHLELPTTPGRKGDNDCVRTQVRQAIGESNIRVQLTAGALRSTNSPRIEVHLCVKILEMDTQFDDTQSRE